MAAWSSSLAGALLDAFAGSFAFVGSGEPVLAARSPCGGLGRLWAKACALATRIDVPSEVATRARLMNTTRESACLRPRSANTARQHLLTPGSMRHMVQSHLGAQNDL